MERPKRDFDLAFAPTRYRAEEGGRTRGMDDKRMPCRPSRTVRPPLRPQGVFDPAQARLATNFQRRSIPPRVLLAYELRTPDLTQSHECKHTWDSRVGVWYGPQTSCMLCAYYGYTFPFTHQQGATRMTSTHPAGGANCWPNDVDADRHTNIHGAAYPRTQSPGVLVPARRAQV